MIRILIADDHPLVRGGLKQILEEEFEGVRIEEVDHSMQALERVSAKQWDLVLLDINMPGRGGLDVLADIKRLCPKLPVLILSAAPEGDYALRALKAGASGYINKQHATEELIVAVRTVLAGHNYVSAALAQKLAASVRQGGAGVAHESLSDREFQIFRLIALGTSVKEIAAQLSLSDKTVATYLSRIKEKTGLGSHVEIARYAFQNKLVE